METKIADNDGVGRLVDEQIMAEGGNKNSQDSSIALSIDQQQKEPTPLCEVPTKMAAEQDTLADQADAAQFLLEDSSTGVDVEAARAATVAEVKAC